MKQSLKRRLASLSSILIAGGIIVSGVIALSQHESQGNKVVFAEGVTVVPVPSATPMPTAATTPQPTVTPAATPTVTPVPELPSVTVTLDYVNEVLTVSKGPLGSTKFYFSQDKQKTWQLVEDSQGKLDLSIFMKSSDNKIYFKGDKDLGIKEVIIPKEDKTLKVKYVVSNGTGKLEFTNAAGSTLQYRKGTNGTWKDYSAGMDLTDYEINGYTLQFRKKATTSTRAGKIVNVKIAKRQKTPTIKVDYSDYTISGLKAESTMYRIVGKTDWIKFNPADSKVKSLDLAAILLPSSTTQNSVPIPGATIEFYTLATDKKVKSGILAIQTITQPAAPATSSVTLNSTTITFTNASKTVPYEYVVLHANEKLDLSTARWKKVSNTKPITIKKIGTAIPVPGDVIYFRRATVTDYKTKEVTPASMYSSVTITSISIN